MKQVKGTMLIILVKSIKVDHKNRSEYERILSGEANDFLKTRILTGLWYPFEIYKELFDALCVIEAKNNPKIIFQWCLNEAKRWFTSIYSSTIVKDDLHKVLDNYTRFHRKIFNFGEVDVKFISDTELHFTYIDMPFNWPTYYFSAAGWGSRFIELCTGNMPNYSYLNKSWENEGWTKIKFSWNA